MAKVDGQPWYWGNADRETVAAALSSQEDGSFVVRDATVPGSFTLTVRCKGATRLARIVSVNGRFGFVPTDLHESVEALVEHHKTKSLMEFNPQMDTCLVTGIPMPPPKRRGSTPSASIEKEKEENESDIDHETRKESSSEGDREKKTESPSQEPKPLSNPSNDTEFDRRINMERFRTAQTNLYRAERGLHLYEVDYDKCLTLHHNFTKMMSELQRKISEMTEISDNQQSSLKTGGMDERTTEAITNNNKIITKSIKKLQAENAMYQERRDTLKDCFESLRDSIENMKTKIDTEIIRRESSLNDLLLVNKVSIQQMENTIAHLKMMSDKESIDQAMQLLDRKIDFDPASYLIWESSKTYAAKLLEEAKQRITEQGSSADGIFLIRPSASQPGYMVLDLLIANRIVHFLIEQGSEGWAFTNTTIWFITIGDLVRFFTTENLSPYCKGLPEEVYLVHPVVKPKTW